MNLKASAIGLLKFVLLSIALFACFVVSSALMGLGASSQPAEDASQAATVLPLLCGINALVLAYPIVRSRWHGVKLIGVIALTEFGAETFMSQIETIFFGSAFNISQGQLIGIILAGAVRALLFAPLAVWILGKVRPGRRQQELNTRLVMPPREWLWRLAFLPIVYVCLYFLFGYFVAWQSPDVRQFYTASTAIQPFFAHMATQLSSNPIIFPFQLVRGLIWIGLALPMIRMMQGKAWETSLAVGLLMGLLLTTQLLLPNPYMPAPVRLAHFVETSTSTFLYGALIGWLFSLPARQDVQGARVAEAKAA